MYCVCVYIFILVGNDNLQKKKASKTKISFFLATEVKGDFEIF